LSGQNCECISPTLPKCTGNGECVVNRTRAFCDCDVGWEGDLCEKKIITAGKVEVIFSFVIK